MSAIFLSTEELERRLNHPDNSARGSVTRRNANAEILTPEVVVLPKQNGGRRPGDRTLSIEERAMIGIAAQFDTIKNVSREMGVSADAVSGYKNGKVGHKEDAELLERVEGKTNKVKEAAVDVLLVALGCLTPEKLQSEEAKDVADIASKMASVMERVTPKGDAAVNVGQLVIYKPETKSLADYEEVKALPPPAQGPRK